jgi:hypothetical protein
MRIITDHSKRIDELYEQGLNKTEIGKQICLEQNCKYTDSYRTSISKYLKKKKFKELSDNPGLIKECEDAGIDFENVKHFWYKSKKYSINVKGDEKVFSYDDFKEDFKDFASKLSPKHIEIKRKQVHEGHCLLIDPSDIHVNKLCDAYEVGEEYNSQIAVQRTKDGVRGIIQKSSGFNIDKVVLIVGNDVLNTDTKTNTTTKGTPQSTHQSWFSAFKMAKQLYVDIIDTLVQIADLEIVYNTSNHDEMSGFFLMDSICSWYRNHPNITFNESPANRKYTIYGKNLIGTTHGDGAKTQDLPLLMCHEASEHWHYCKHRYFFTHHVHHKSSKDVMSVQLESLRSPSPADSWHDKMGYKFAPLAIEGFLFHKEFGQVARLTTLF